MNEFTLAKVSVLCSGPVKVRGAGSVKYSQQVRTASNLLHNAQHIAAAGSMFALQTAELPASLLLLLLLCAAVALQAMKQHLQQAAAGQRQLTVVGEHCSAMP